MHARPDLQVPFLSAQHTTKGVAVAAVPAVEPPSVLVGSPVGDTAGAGLDEGGGKVADGPDGDAGLESVPPSKPHANAPTASAQDTTASATTHFRPLSLSGSAREGRLSTGRGAVGSMSGEEGRDWGAVTACGTIGVVRSTDGDRGSDDAGASSVCTAPGLGAATGESGIARLTVGTGATSSGAA